MFDLLWNNVSPIGVDIGVYCIKAVQLTGDRSQVLDAKEIDLPSSWVEQDNAEEMVAEGLGDLLHRGRFRGRRVVMSLGCDEISVQNIRVSSIPGKDLEEIVLEEARGRASIELDQAEVRFLEAGIVQHGEMQRREIVFVAARRAAVERKLRIAMRARLVLGALDAEPLALVRTGIRQYRRESDQNQTIMFVHIGSRATLVVTVRNERILFAKYIELGGKDFDSALSHQFHIPAVSARSLRRTYGDRRIPERDPEIVAAVHDCLRPVWNRWLEELARCLRYCNVTFRGQPAERIVLSGEEATSELQELATRFFEIPVDILNCFRAISCPARITEPAAWDIAVGLALHSGRSQRGVLEMTGAEEMKTAIN